MKNHSSVLIIFTGGTIGMIKKDNQYIPVQFKDLISPYEVLESPDSRKLGLLLKSVKASSNIN